MALHPLAGKPAPESILANIPRLVNPATGSHLGRPDIAAVPINTVSMKGTSWPSARPFVNIEPARALTGRCSWASILTHCRSRP